MPNIFRSVSNYQANFASINTTEITTSECRKLDLYRSIITVGNPSYLTLQDIRQFGFARALYSSILEKVAIVAGNIDSTPAGMRRHPIFDSYISDKKRIVSYNLGMAFAKFYSEKLLNIPNLVHIEFLKKQGVVTFVPQAGGVRSQEPDLVGQTADGNWHVFEAKGFSTKSQLKGKILEAKTQVQQIATIHGVPPTTGTACATYIGNDQILTYLEDPPSNDGKKLDVDKGKFLEAYYAPFLLAEKSLNQSIRKVRIDGLDVEFYDLERASIKLSIGLDSEVAETLRVKKYELPQNLGQRLKNYSSSDGKFDKYSIGLDGFVVGYTNY